MNQLRSITPLQWVGIILMVNGVLSGSASQMTDLLGPVWAAHVGSIAVMGSGICGGLITMFGGQGAMIRGVAAMPGVEAIKVNSLANATLATIAVDQAQGKVETLPEAKSAVAATAKGAAL